MVGCKFICTITLNILGIDYIMGPLNHRGNSKDSEIGQDQPDHPTLNKFILNSNLKISFLIFNWKIIPKWSL